MQQVREFHHRLDDTSIRDNMDQRRKETVEGTTRLRAMDESQVGALATPL